MPHKVSERVIQIRPLQFIETVKQELDFLGYLFRRSRILMVRRYARVRLTSLEKITERDPMLFRQYPDGIHLQLSVLLHQVLELTDNMRHSGL